MCYMNIAFVTDRDSRMTISVIIPTLNPGERISALLERVATQTRKPDEIIVVDSASADGTPKHVTEFAQSHPEAHVRLLPIERKDFDHGGTRDMALRESHGDFMLFLTHDAMPEDDTYIERLLAPFQDEQVAMVTGRQIARPDARPSEKLVREFNYPAASHVRSAADIEHMGIKAFFASDVCSAYRRTAYLEVGGFEHPLSTNEDMFIAAAFLHAGWKIAYAADAHVVHSHNFTLKQQYRRNYLMGREIEQHKELLHGAAVTGEGMALVRSVMAGLLSHGHIASAIYFCFDCAARLLGNREGSRAGKKTMF